MALTSWGLFTSANQTDAGDPLWTDLNNTLSISGEAFVNPFPGSFNNSSIARFAGPVSGAEIPAGSVITNIAVRTSASKATNISASLSLYTIVGGGTSFTLSITPINTPVILTRSANLGSWGITQAEALEVANGTREFRFRANASDNVNVAVQYVQIQFDYIAPPIFTGTIPTQGWLKGTAVNVPTASYFGSPEGPTYSGTGALPAGLTLNTSTGVISGTPTVTGAGTYQVTCTNSVGSDTSNVFSWASNYPPIFTGTVPSQIWSKGVPVSLNTAPYFGSPYPAVTYTSDGTLPTGVTFNTGSGLLSGTPSVVTNGTYRVTATNSVGAASTNIFTWSVVGTSVALPGVF